MQLNQQIDLLFFFCSQEEIRIQTTTVFVDPYEEADAQVRIVGWLVGWFFVKGQSSSLENFVT